MSELRRIDADDAAARERALDGGRSFLVQAPAGSGKTELLIQRYLMLLAAVEQPERILAMTFTRKAAGEMRERIITALSDALADKPTGTQHEARTRQLARAALTQDRLQGWHLVTHPARLGVYTIDALAAALARQAPIATGMGALPRYEEHAEALYIEAARAALAAASATDAGWLRLLGHLDNDAGRAIALVADMLAKRDQWIGELRPDDRALFRANLDATLAAEIAGQLATIAALVPVPMRRSLAAAERYAATNLSADPALPLAVQLAAQLAAMADAGGLPAPVPEQLEHWRALANWLLVANDARFRQQVNVRQGFPAKGSGYGADERGHQNRTMAKLLEELASVPELATGFHVARSLPSPQFDDDTWTLVEALLEILPRAAAHLMLQFRERGAIDFTQGALAAIDALGDEGAPTDLLLKVDLRLQHVLVDEFQDTSFTQLALLRRLTAGWEAGDGRTLFAVGDPMQSVYRFRGAEVRLFVDAKVEGRIGDIPVDNIVLRRNFRSQAALVDWIGGVFPSVLGAISDPWRGMVEFVPAVAAKDSLAGPAATVELFVDPLAEADAVVGHIRAALAAGAEDVAVLVRARFHLAQLLPKLRAAGIPFAAVELDALAERQPILDLVSLTHALLQPTDRLAWLAVLRAPWCGLVLPDIYAVVADADARTERSVAALVLARVDVDGLSADGRVRWLRLADKLAPALEERGRGSVAFRVRGAWLALGGPATLEEDTDLDAAEKYFALLAEREVAGGVPEWASFLDALRMLYAAPDRRDPARVQLMTLHRAKGLEFDAVIIPALDRIGGGGKEEILRWRRRPRGLLLAPIAARKSSAGSVYSYLEMLARGEEDAELGRLLYVGCTRARRRLHLTGVLGVNRNADGSPGWKPPASGAALARLWEGLGACVAPPIAIIPSAPAPLSPRPIGRLPLDWEAPRPVPGVPVVPSSPRLQTPPFDWARAVAGHIGTVAHRLFAEIADQGVEAWNAGRIADLAPRIRAELVVAGVDDVDLSGAIESVATAAARLIADERGRWLLDPAHAERRSEWALGGIEGHAVARVVLDRTFVADGIRWIVDFKTGTHQGSDVEAFLDREQERYRDQLERYARFVRALDSRPIRLALYYPMLGGWREWPSSA